MHDPKKVESILGFTCDMPIIGTMSITGGLGRSGWLGVTNCQLFGIDAPPKKLATALVVWYIRFLLYYPVPAGEPGDTPFRSRSPLSLGVP